MINKKKMQQMQGSSSTKGRLPPTITPQMILYLWEQPQAVTCQTPSSVHSPGQSRVWQRHITTFGRGGTPHVLMGKQLGRGHHTSLEETRTNAAQTNDKWQSSAAPNDPTNTPTKLGKDLTSKSWDFWAQKRFETFGSMPKLELGHHTKL